MDRTLRNSLTSAAVIAAVLAMRGCQGSAGPTAGKPSDRSHELRQALDAARKQGADQSQIALLEKGEPTFESYQEAINRSIECVRRAGIDVINNGIDSSGGFPLIDVGYAASAPGQTEQQTRDLTEDCQKRFNRWINALYQTGPAAVDGMNRQFETKRVAYIACLRKYGVNIADDATRQEAENAEVRVSHEHPGTSCHAEVGLG